MWVHKNNLYVAMAGSHQIWKMPLSESDIGPYAGNGREDIVDGKLLPRVPEGRGGLLLLRPAKRPGERRRVAVCRGQRRELDAAVPFDGSREVTTVVGSAQLPERRLFAFGDADGPRNVAKLQHCIGITFADGTLYVADTYNNRIREVNPRTGEVKTLAGTGYNRPGNDDAAGSFDEPAGISHAKGMLYVADTNNHSIRTIDLSSGKVGTLAIPGLTSPSLPKVVARPTFGGAAQGEAEVDERCCNRERDCAARLLEAPRRDGNQRQRADGILARLAASDRTLGSRRVWQTNARKARGRFRCHRSGERGGGGCSRSFLQLSLLPAWREWHLRQELPFVFTIPLNITTSGSAKPIVLTHTIGE